jgi:hypothetical protein
MFELTTWHASFLDFLISLRHYTVIGNQFFISNDRNRVRWVVSGLLQDGACNDIFENLSENTFKGDLSNATSFNPPLFSLVDTFKTTFRVWCLYSYLILGVSGRTGKMYNKSIQIMNANISAPFCLSFIYDADTNNSQRLLKCLGNGLIEQPNTLNWSLFATDSLHCCLF